MAETNFIKTTAFGGYDKTDVSKRLDYLYTQVYELKNELRESKLSLEEYKKGTEEEKVHESILSAERAKLTMVQVQNESLGAKVKEAREENAAQKAEIDALSSEVEQLKAQLDAANSEIEKLRSTNDGAALSKVFIEAQKSADMLVDDAKNQVAVMESDAKKLVENMIIEANNTAQRIIYDAEKEAAELTASSRNDSEKMKTASDNLRVIMLDDIKTISEQFTKLKEVFAVIEECTTAKIKESQDIIEKTENKLCSGGVPVFRQPEEIAAELPQEPEYAVPDYNYASTSGSAASEAEAAAEAVSEVTNTDTGSTASEGGIDLEALMKQAASLTE
ncbi:MAG: plectin [Oscillospiraceae bacterium]|nr:plectin [Oscillospiraceae bacterium]